MKAAEESARARFELHSLPPTPTFLGERIYSANPSEALARLICHGGELEMKPALLIIDVQKEFFNISQTCSDSLKSAVEYINATIVLFRKKSLPIFVIQHKSDNEGLAPGKSGFDIPESLKVEPQDTRIVKTYGNSFAKTGLAEKLREQGVDTVILTGFCAEFCVLSTFRGAQDLDFAPIIVKGSVASDNAEHIRFVEEISETISLGALKTLL